MKKITVLFKAKKSYKEIDFLDYETAIFFITRLNQESIQISFWHENSVSSRSTFIKPKAVILRKLNMLNK